MVLHLIIFKITHAYTDTEYRQVTVDPWNLNIKKPPTNTRELEKETVKVYVQ